MADRFRLADPDRPFLERYLLQFESGHDVNSVWHALLSNADWMVGNTILALIPAVLAYLVFERGVTRTWLRWILIAAFVAFLPNALYVVTDLIHLVEQGDQLSWSAGVLLVLVPTYALFVAVGVVAYAASFLMLFRWLQRRIGRRAAIGACGALHLASACGIYLGRVLRLNSWQFVTDPAAVVDGIYIMLSRTEALAYVLTVACVGGVLVALATPAARQLVARGSARRVD